MILNLHVYDQQILFIICRDKHKKELLFCYLLSVIMVIKVQSLNTYIACLKFYVLHWIQMKWNMYTFLKTLNIFDFFFVNLFIYVKVYRIYLFFPSIILWGAVFLTQLFELMIWLDELTFVYSNFVINLYKKVDNQNVWLFFFIYNSFSHYLGHNVTGQATGDSSRIIFYPNHMYVPTFYHVDHYWKELHSVLTFHLLAKDMRETSCYKVSSLSMTIEYENNRGLSVAEW
jgi:hypothetical protein